jgi:hypothetical protein
MDAGRQADDAAAFAAFIEDRIAEIASVTPEEEAGVRPVVPDRVRDPRRHDDALARPGGACLFRREGAHTLSSGEKEIVFHEEHDTKITVPGLFMVSVPAFLDASPVRLPARLRYRVRRLDLVVLPAVPLEGVAARRDRQDVAIVTQRNRTARLRGHAGAGQLMPVTLAKQLAAVQRAVINLRGHVANLSGLAERGKRPRIEYEMAAAWFKDLEAAGNTFEMVAKDERIVRFIESQNP